MTVCKLSISVPPEIAELIKDAAAREGASVSAWMAHAAERQAALATSHDEGLVAATELVSEYETAHGPIPESSKRFGRMVLAELGLAPLEDDLKTAA